jgi:DNA-binding transcriptional regulator YdaS (Cro superfamily)
MQTLHDHILAAINIHGSQAKLADAMGCSQQQISYLLRAKAVSAKMALRIEDATGGAVSRHALCPEIFGPPPMQEAS